MQDSILRDLHLRGLLTGKIQGPLTNKPSIDKPWLKYYSEKAISSTLDNMTVYDYLYECNKNYFERVALNYFGRKITFKELFTNIDATAEAFIEMGVKKGDIITVCTPNVPQGVIMFYAANYIGAIASMVHPLSSEAEIEYYVNDTKSKVILTFRKRKCNTQSRFFALNTERKNRDELPQRSPLSSALEGWLLAPPL